LRQQRPERNVVTFG